MAKGQKHHCGNVNAPKWIRKILSCKFNASCRLHDIHYGKNTKYSRKVADLKFKKNMLKQAKNNVVWKVLANIFYLTVRILGKKAYKGKK